MSLQASCQPKREIEIDSAEGDMYEIDEDTATYCNQVSKSCRHDFPVLQAGDLLIKTRRNGDDFDEFLPSK